MNRLHFSIVVVKLDLPQAYRQNNGHSHNWSAQSAAAWAAKLNSIRAVSWSLEV
jgi:hypothetical protein